MVCSMSYCCKRIATVPKQGASGSETQQQMGACNWHMRHCYCAAPAVALFLSYLCSGHTFPELAQQFRVGTSTARKICIEVVNAILQVLRPIFLPPVTTAGLVESEKQFRLRWNFPNCILAVDGKHCSTKAPRNSGSLYYNYKRFFSIVLMAGAGADYKFLYASAGYPGRFNDASIFASTSFTRDVEELVPPDKPLPGTTAPMPMVIIGDEAFALKRHLMRPYPGCRLKAATPEQRRRLRVYNYRLSRARRVVENAFGLLSQRFRVLLKPLDVEPFLGTKVIMACVVLHNFLIEMAGRSYTADVDSETSNGDIVGGNWRQGQQMPEWQPGNRVNFATRDAVDVRDLFCDYFSTVGSLPYQNEMIERGYC